MALEDRVLTLSKLKSFGNCPHRFYLEEFVGFNRIPLSLRAAAQRFFQQERKRFYEVNDGRKIHFPRVQRRAGKLLKDVEEMNSEELREFMPNESTESFGSSLAFGKRYPSFKRVIEKETYAGRDLATTHPGESGSLTFSLSKSLTNYAEFSISELAPVISLLDFRTYFDVGKERFSVNVGELRPRIIDGKYYVFVDQPNFGPFSTGKLSDGIYDSPLVTLTLMAVTDLISNYELPQWQLNMPKAFIELLAEEKPKIAPRLIYRHIDFSNGTKIIEQKRTDEDAIIAEELVEGIAEKVKKWDFEPNTTNCSSCHLSSTNINNRLFCEESHANSSNQTYVGVFNTKNYQITSEENNRGFEIVCKVPVTANGERNLLELAREEIIFEEKDGVTINFVYSPTLFEASGKNAHYTLPFKQIYWELRKEIKNRLGNKKVRMVTQTPNVSSARDFLEKRGFEKSGEIMYKDFR